MTRIPSVQARLSKLKAVQIIASVKHFEIGNVSRIHPSDV